MHERVRRGGPGCRKSKEVSDSDCAVCSASDQCALDLCWTVFVCYWVLDGIETGPVDLEEV